MSPVPSFSPAFDDPRTLGWGGRRLFSVGAIVFICLLCLGALWMVFAMLYGAHSKEIIWWWACWLPLWMLGSGLFWWRHGVVHPPCVVCDAQGLTLYRRDRIVGQWRWQALQRVDALPARRLLVIMPHAGGRYLYGERRLSAADCTDIIRTAQAFMQGTAAAPPVPAVSRQWFKRNDTAYAAVSRLSLALMVICFIGYALVDGWRQSLQPKTPFDDEPAPYALLFVIVAVTVLLFLLYAIARLYRFYLTGQEVLLAALDGKGLTVHFPGSRSVHVPWAEMRDIRAVQRRTKHGTTEYLLWTDRLGNTREISADHLESFATAEEIVVAVNAVRHGMPLLPPGKNAQPGGIPRGAVAMFWTQCAGYGVIFCSLAKLLPLPEGVFIVLIVLLLVTQFFPQPFFGWLDR